MVIGVGYAFSRKRQPTASLSPLLENFLAPFQPLAQSAGLELRIVLRQQGSLVMPVLVASKN